jgi:hypothetical protein
METKHMSARRKKHPSSYTKPSAEPKAKEPGKTPKQPAKENKRKAHPQGGTKRQANLKKKLDKKKKTAAGGGMVIAGLPI